MLKTEFYADYQIRNSSYCEQMMVNFMIAPEILEQAKDS